MADSQRRSITRARLLFVTALAALLLMSSARANADIILDEFTDTAVVTEFPTPFNPDFVETPDVGPLEATRQIRIATAGALVTGSFDINATSPGRLNTQVEEIERSSPGLVVSGVQFNYAFEPTDVTDGGGNDAILFDFVELVGEVQPSFLRAWVFDDTNIGYSYIVELSPLVENRSPHTLVAPFDHFTLRDFSPGVPDATTLREIRFDFYFLGHEGELNWSAQLERIRFGSTAVPEPGVMQLAWTGVAACCCIRSRRKGVRGCLSRYGWRVGSRSSHARSPQSLRRRSSPS